MTTVKEEWESYASKTGLSLAPEPIQEKFRVIFYFGVLSCLSMHADLARASGQLEALKTINGWWGEMAEFNDEIIELQLKIWG